MSFSVGPMTSPPEPVAAHETEFKYLSVRRYGDDAPLDLAATAQQPIHDAVRQDAVHTGSLDALTGFAALRPAEFVIVRFAQHLGPGEGTSS